MYRKLYWLLFAVFFSNICIGQYKYQPVLKAYTGTELLTKLVDFYKPPTVLDYNTARDTLFSKIYKEGDSLVCLYSDYKIYLPAGVDPTTFAYMNGSKNGINTEHAYPQSKGAVGGAKSDMNHLFPAKANLNEARGNLPYGESQDNKTQKWFYKEIEKTTIPPINIELYSEQNALLFEPRESVKGNLARAVFYFFTMYHEEAIDADPNFFEGQVNTLCQWHLVDPVDSLEWTRAEIISKYQGNRTNPFVLDCTLPYRTYCPNYAPLCDTTNVVSTDDLLNSSLKVFPNPAKNAINFCLEGDESISSISIYNLNGTAIASIQNESKTNCIYLNLSEQIGLSIKGLYFAKVFTNGSNKTKFIFTKFIVD